MLSTQQLLESTKVKYEYYKITLKSIKKCIYEVYMKRLVIADGF